MNDDKPFACNITECSMKFTNIDHLTVHKKRHEMNLTFNNKLGGFADQTPTPTRFIRNCEEVGLFQDLQNVNPFEETFRKAVEAVNQGEIPLLGKETRATLADDTLHTPNVFPPVNETPPTREPTDCQARRNDNDKSQLLNLPPQRPRKYSRKMEFESCPTNASAESHLLLLDKNVTFKLPIPKIPPSIKVFSHKYFAVFSKHSKQTSTRSKRELEPKKSSVRPKNSGNRTKSKDEILEINRIAQMRTREKRKHYLSYLEQLNNELTEKNTRLEDKIRELTEENLVLKWKFNSTQRGSFYRHINYCDASQQTIESTASRENDPSEALQSEITCQMLKIGEQMKLNKGLQNCQSTRNSEITIKPPNQTPLEEHNYLAGPVGLTEEKSRCFYSSLPSSLPSETVDTINVTPSEGFLRKPFKKRSIPPKLSLNTNNIPMCS